ncbi:hypothetical protein ACE3M9_02350 [Borrelia recurrentis]
MIKYDAKFAGWLMGDNFVGFDYFKIIEQVLSFVYSLKSVKL